MLTGILNRNCQYAIMSTAKRILKELKSLKSQLKIPANKQRVVSAQYLPGWSAYFSTNNNNELITKRGNIFLAIVEVGFKKKVMLVAINQWGSYEFIEEYDTFRCVLPSEKTLDEAFSGRVHTEISKGRYVSRHVGK